MKTIFAIITLLTIGGAAGWSYSNQSGPQNQMNAEQNRQTDQMEQTDNRSDMPAAADFVSLRPVLESLPTETLSADELSGLLYMREEEKLARDVYTTLYEAWGLQIFANIAQSEQTHTEAVRDLLEKYELADPVTDDTVGVFTDPDLQQLYDDLTARGLTSVEEALQVGALIEDLDIYDLTQEIAKTDNKDIVLVYENLTRGSRNHMRAFTSQLTARGETYTPKYLTQAEYDAIISAEQERGGGHSSGGNGGGSTGRGWGNR